MATSGFDMYQSRFRTRISLTLNPGYPFEADEMFRPDFAALAARAA
jgi:hypothetical protein